ncbi:C-type lectin domain family 17, member A-like [Pecten maximus]|uniref:C-type lectin domain family 17, member A-like n=1 Tax=Pecten maximus TaxID=6579 RepID=UPI0014582416|nr:C-type lectin domain family 17, member A-like [Pecten maximus]
MNATLVRVDNAEVHTFLILEMTKREMTHMWLAANDRAVEGEWVWGPGDEVLNAMWDSTEPNNYGDEDCVILNQDEQSWNDWGCARGSNRAYAVCEVDFEFPP